jgi:hypothetical protein
MERRSRAIAVIGMHRSGTSAVARGLQALGVYLGNDFLDAQPENPTGYWEDRGIVELNERVLKTVGLRWDHDAPIERRRLGGWGMWGLRREAMRHVHRNFTGQALWGFKDPRTIRVLPFWLRVLHDCDVSDDYLLVIRHPSSVAASLYARQQMEMETAQRLWLAYMVPFLRELAGKQLVVVDYDLLMLDPSGQLDRIRQKLALPATGTQAEVDRFASDFLDLKLRHSFFSPEQIEASTDAGRLTRDAMMLLYELASDKQKPDGLFWQEWKDVESSFVRLGMTPTGRG